MQQAAAYPVNHTGAYHYVVQVLLNNFASSQQSLYAVLENNGFENDILGIMFISVNELAYLQFINHETGKVQLINQADLAKLYVWIAYCNHCAKAGHRLCTPEDILAINASSFKNFCEDYISQHGDFGDLWNVPRACFTFDASAASQYVWEILLQQCPKRNRRFYTVLEQTGLLDDVWTIQDMSENQLRALMFLDPETNVKRQITMADFVTLQTWKQYTTKCFQDGYPITNVQDVLSIDPSEFDTWHFNLEDDECKHERSYIPPISYKIPDCYNCKPFEDSLTNCIDYSSTTQSVHEPSTALQSTSNEPLPGNGENNDNNLPVKTHATANNVSITESSLGTGENIISVPVPTPVNEKEIYKKAYDHSYNVSITSVHSAQSIGTIDCASGELYDEELLDASVSLDWSIDMDYQVLDWSFDLWGETTIPSSSLLMSDQALPSDSNEEPSDSNEELVTFYDAEDPMFVNLLPDIDGTTAVIPDTSMIILGTSEADHNSSVSVGIKVTTAPTEPCGMCNCINRESLFCIILHAAEKQMQHGTDGIFRVTPKEPPAKQPPPEPPPPEPPPTGEGIVYTTTSIYGETVLMNEEKQFLHLLNDLFLGIHLPARFTLHVTTLHDMTLTYNDILPIIPSPLAYAFIGMCDTMGSVRILEISGI